MLAAGAAILTLGGGALHANTILYPGIGGDIAGVNGDGSPGVTVFSIAIADGYSLPSTGDNLTVELSGLQHPFAGDLVFTLALVVNGNTVASADLFNRIGKTSNDPNDLGYLVQFGNSTTIASGDYVFNSSFTGATADMWSVASGLGGLDSIPSGNYWPTTSFSPAADTLSSSFNGLAIAGTWELRILDYGPLSDAFVPGLASWQLDFNVATPEPALWIPAGVCLAGLCWRQRRRRKSVPPSEI